MNRTAQIILSIFAGILAYVFFVLFFFPLDAVIGHFLAKMEEETKGEWRVAVNRIDSSLLFGTDFFDFRVFKTGKEIFYTPKLSVGASPLAFLGDDIAVSFAATYKDGEISGRAQLKQNKSQIALNVLDIEFDDVAFAELKFVPTSFTVQGTTLSFDGSVRGTVYMQLERDIRSSLVEVDLQLKGVSTNPIFLTDMNLNIPEVILSSSKEEVVLKGVLERGKVEVSKFLVPGPDLRLDLTGSAKVNQNLSVLGLNFNGKVLLSEELLQKVPFLAGIPDLDEQKLPDGSYPISVRQNLNDPQILIGTLDVTQQLNL